MKQEAGVLNEKEKELFRKNAKKHKRLTHRLSCQPKKRKSVYPPSVWVGYGISWALQVALLVILIAQSLK
ncbi:MAG: hypothetical protein IK954_02520 [Clostridia bacterium]|nr:hypothetical protein [Clostridia bacterium]